jgi:hypothetical protein
MSRLPKDFDPIGLTECYIAGGSILSTATKATINDYDIYPKSRKGFEDAVTILMENNCNLINVSNRALTFKSNNMLNNDGKRMLFQVMIFDFFPTTNYIFEHFDFTVCMAAFDCDTKEYAFHPDFYSDIASKTIRFNPKTKYPLNSLIRVTKYQSKGYYISKFENAKIALSIANVGLPNSWEELENQLGGAYGKTIKLHTKDIEFNLENALSLLSDMNFEPAYDDADTDKLEAVKVDELLNCFIEEDVEYFPLKNDENNAYIIEDGYFIKQQFNKTVFSKLDPKPNYKEKISGKIFGYNQKKSFSTYSYGESSKQFLPDKSKFISSTDNKIILFSVDMDKITRIYGLNVYGEVKEEKIVEKDTNRIDDVNDIIFQTLTAMPETFA